MQRSTIVLGAIFALLLMCAALFLVGGTLSGELSVMTARGSDYPSAFESVSRILAADTAIQRFSEPLPDDPAACRLEDVTITLKNNGLLDAEWLSVTVDGAPGDIAVYSLAGEGDSVPALGVASVNLKLISAAGQTGRRVYRIQYYVYGMKREIKIAQDGEDH